MKVILRLALMVLGLTGVGAAIERWARPPVTPQTWSERTSVDPAGDLPKLQGKWKYTAVKKPPFDSDKYLVISGNKALFDYPGLTLDNGKPWGPHYLFAINSSFEPKVIRYFECLNPDNIVRSERTPQNWYYSLEGDTLWLWSHYAERHDGGSIWHLQRLTGEL